MLLHVCTAARGGMRSVVEGYRSAGLFDRWNGEILWSHEEGPLLRRLGRAGKAIVRAVGLILGRRVRLLHCHAAMRGSFWRKSLFAAVALAGRVPVVFHLHGSEFRQFHASQGRMGRFAIRWVLEHVARVVVLSQSWSEFVLNIAPDAKVVVLPNFVAMPNSEPTAIAPDQQAHQTVSALFLGLVGERKGVFDLIPAVQRALREAPQLRVVIGGNGDVEGARRLAQELGVVQAIEFVGWVAGADKERLLREADFYVLPSHNEGLPMSLLEAMSHGLPVISTRVGGIPELVDDSKDGLLIEAGDVGALTSSLVRLASDHVTRINMGRNARTKVEQRFSATSVLPKLEDLYRQLLQST